MVRIEEGFLNIHGLRIYFKLYNVGSRIDLVVLHGGPGASHDYLIPLAELSNYGINVLFYDQFGSGRSDEPSDFSRYTVDYGIEEAEEIRKQVFNDKVVMLGHSYGGMLALAYALKYQDNLVGLIISNGLSSIPLTVQEMRRLIEELPERYRNAIKKYEQIQDYQNPEYLEAVQYFYKQHVTRLDELPEPVKVSFEYAQKRRTYAIMNGPNEFTITGTIKDFDITDQLHKIRVPTLIITGKYDEVTPRIAELMSSKIRDSRLVLFEKSSHMPMWEEKDKYLAVVRDFIFELYNKNK
ncbi:proline iminopeptidase [Vulcanisaeta souniana]|uniref:Proline iminopeptidase n=1 Tax=Vulcanisaeta souniana JCM 11219 TaxID=1293586 RepID=A0A830E3V4_9CREN|nr:proline iminopeptidase-family hydrolase [Vulcanisaeta souniana]BDR91034.1 proline iminopeptidase [Vulcanisaeta souniana JCM 11219]GGI80292.1 proline iminopeptidase [Vulcanisaeta souniana JCM 11219]